MSILQIMKELEGAPDATLQKIITEGDPRYPGWAATTVASQRADMRDRFKKQEAAHQAEQPKIADREASRLGGGIPDVDPNEAGGDPSLATGIAGGMAGGGVVRGYAAGSLLFDEGDEDGVGVGVGGGEDEEGVGVEDGVETAAAMTEMERENLVLSNIIGDAQRYVDRWDQDALSWVGEGSKIGEYRSIEDYPQHIQETEEQRKRDIRSSNQMAGVRGSEFSMEPEGLSGTERHAWNVLLTDSKDNPAKTKYIKQQMEIPVKGGLFGRERPRRADELIPYSEESKLGLGSTYSRTYKTPAEVKADQAVADEEMITLAELIAQQESSAERIATADRSIQDRYLRESLGLIDDYGSTAEWNEDDTRLQEMKRNENTILINQARRVSDERGENAEERQEIYDALVKDLKEQRSDMERTERHRRAGDEGRNLANTLANLGKSGGIENVLTYGTAVEAEKEAFRDSLRSLTTEDYDKITGELEGLQTYAAKTGTDLDSAVTAAMRGETDLFRDKSQHEEELAQELLKSQLDMYGKVLPGAAQRDIHAASNKAALEAAKIQSSAQLTAFAADPTKWESIEDLLDDAIRRNEADPLIQEELREAGRYLSTTAVQSLMEGLKASGQSGGMPITSQTIKNRPQTIRKLADEHGVDFEQFKGIIERMSPDARNALLLAQV